MCCVSGSALIWSAGSGPRRAKKTHKHRQKLINFMFLSAGCSLLRAEGFFCCLDFPHGGLGITTMAYYSSLKFLQFLDVQTFDPHWPKMLDPDPHWNQRINNTRTEDVFYQGSKESSYGKWKIVKMSLKVDGNEKWGGSRWRQFFHFSLAMWRSRVISSLNVPSRQISEALRILANRTRPLSHCVFKIWTITTPIVLAQTCLYLK
jgi:hypothetical protein